MPEYAHCCSKPKLQSQGVSMLVLRLLSRLLMGAAACQPNISISRVDSLPVTLPCYAVLIAEYGAALLLSRRWMTVAVSKAEEGRTSSGYLSNGFSCTAACL